MRALEHDLKSISERISNLEKAEQLRQKQLLKRLERLDQIEKRLAVIEPKKRKKKK
jgi:Ni,Fe-hydrogenase maturation factor